MTKTEIQEAAQLAAQDIKKALEKFSHTTGLRADVYTDYLTLNSHGGESEVFLQRVEVTPIFPVAGA